MILQERVNNGPQPEDLTTREVLQALDDEARVQRRAVAKIRAQGGPRAGYVADYSDSRPRTWVNNGDTTMSIVFRLGEREETRVLRLTIAPKERIQLDAVWDDVIHRIANVDGELAIIGGAAPFLTRAEPPQEARVHPMLIPAAPPFAGGA